MASRPLGRPKRAGEEFARTHFQDVETDGQTSKKPRFDVRNPSALAPDAIEEDAILDADEIGKRGQQTKRSAVNIDGYDSDSSNEGFDARADLKAKENTKENKNNKSKDEEQNDMFADLDENDQGGADGDDDEDLAREGKKKAKNVRFLGEEEIEGQVASSKSGGHVSADFSISGQGRGGKNGINGSGGGDDSSSESDAGDEERADVGSADEEVGAGGKKEHAPRLDAFNMKGEQEEGRFDDQGNYVRKAVDPDAVHDSWLEGVSKKDMKRAKEAAEKRDEEQRQRNLQDDSLLTSDILKTLIPYLDRGETSLEALARLGRGKPKSKPKWRKQQRKPNGSEAMDVDETNKDPPTEEDAAEQRRRTTVEAITGAADQLLTRGQTEIYDTERESLIRQYTRETGDEWTDPPNVHDQDKDDEDDDITSSAISHKQWEYRWADARDGGTIHGPYPQDMMKSWNEAGYFGEGVEFRRVDDPRGWSRVGEFG